MSEETFGSVGRTRVGFMDKVDFDEELSHAKGGNTVFASVKDLEYQKPCCKECGIVKVEVKCLEVIQEEVPVTERPGFQEGVKRAQERARCKVPIPYIRPDQIWIKLGKIDYGTLMVIDHIDGETIYWKDGTTIQARNLNDGAWGVVHPRTPRPPRPD
jgi:hypothetical protein